MEIKVFPCPFEMDGPQTPECWDYRYVPLFLVYAMAGAEPGTLPTKPHAYPQLVFFFFYNTMMHVINCHLSHFLRTLIL